MWTYDYVVLEDAVDEEDGGEMGDEDECML